MTILVLGNATVDLFYEVERLPVAGETLLASSKFIDAGGKGLNQAVVAHRAGAQVQFCAAIGNDAHVASDGPSGPRDTTGRSSALLTDDWRPMLAGDGGPVGAGD